MIKNERRIDFPSVELIFVGGSVALAIVFKQLLILPLVIAIVCLFARKKRVGNFLIKTQINWAINGLGILGALSLLVTVFPEITIPQVLRLFNGIILFYALVGWTNKRQRFWVLLGLLITVGVILGLLSPISVNWNINKLQFLHMDFLRGFHTVMSDTVHPNVMAGAILLIVGLAYALLLFAWGELQWGFKISVAIAALLMSTVIVITKSRGAWMGLAAMLFVMLFLKWKRFGAGILFLALVSLVVAWSILGLNGFVRKMLASGIVAGFDIRMEIWSRALAIIHDFAFTGIGMGSYGPIVDQYYPFFIQAPGLTPHAHNLFLQIAVDLGLPGLFFWLVIWIYSMMGGWKVFKSGVGKGDHLLQGIGAGIFATQIAMGVHGLTDAVVWGMVRSAPLVWAIWGLSVSGFQLFVLRTRDKDKIPDAPIEDEKGG